MTGLRSIVVLISGNGSNLQAMIDAIQRDQLDLEIRAVISDQSDAYGLVRARAAGIPSHVLPQQHFHTRSAWEEALQRLIDLSGADMICLSGFMRRLSPACVRRYVRRILNIHPSLLPKYPGLHTHARAIAARERWHGATIHWVTEALDEGPIVSYSKIPLFLEEPIPQVIARVQALEHVLYPTTLRWFVSGRFCFQNGIFLFDGQPVPSTGVLLEYNVL